jgi:hypothetical protein
MRVSVPIPISVMAELETMATTNALSLPQFLRMIVVQHVERTRARRETQAQPMRRRGQEETSS